MDLTGPNLDRRVGRLSSYTILNEEEAQVQARRELDWDNEQVAGDLGIPESDVVEALESIDEKITKAQRTLHMIPEEMIENTDN